MIAPRGLAAVLILVALLVAPPAAAEDARTWTSTDAYTSTEPWWDLQLEERIGIGNAQSAIFSSTGSVTVGVGVATALHVDHHWLFGAVLAFDFFAAPPTVTDAYASVDTTVTPLDTTLAVRIGYLPLALSWMTLGIVVEAGLLIDSTTVTSGGSDASGVAALGAFSGTVQLSFFPFDALELGVRAGYRYLVGERTTLATTDAASLHVPKGPFRQNGDVMVTIYEALHF